jgi:hypothetical protein
MTNFCPRVPGFRLANTQVPDFFCCFFTTDCSLESLLVVTVYSRVGGWGGYTVLGAQFVTLSVTCEEYRVITFCHNEGNIIHDNNNLCVEHIVCRPRPIVGFTDYFIQY